MTASAAHAIETRTSPLRGLDHVQVAIPPGAEDRCRPFYVGVLGMTELTKPPILTARDGLWLRGGPVTIHLGVEPEFRPARKAHPALLVSDIDDLARRMTAAGFEPTWDHNNPAVRRFFASDPVGNRLEFIAEKTADG